MVFSSSVFLFVFLPIVVGVYYLINDKLKNIWLLLASLVFYAWNKPSFLWILVGSILLNYVAALCIEKLNSLRRLFLVLSVVLNLALLFYFKYFNFTIKIINRVFQKGIETNVLLPIGISFFTFQGLSYVVDVYRKDTRAQRNLAKLAMYVAMFPQLVAGPIVRYKDINAQIDTRRVSLEDFSNGLQRFVLGLFRKVVIADSLAVIADAIFALRMTNRGAMVAWLGIIAYSLQIFFDFSGYSDMAIGMGRMFGFRFLENFNYPYISKSITEFWRRWHISLSSFFKDYVYIPLGGNRKHVYLNVAIVFLLTGIWHGAAFTFIVWGIWHGIFNLTEKWLKGKVQVKPSAWFSCLQHIYTLLVVMLGWVVFRADNLTVGIKYIRSLFGLVNSCKPVYELSYFLDRWNCLILLLAILWATPLFAKLGELVKKWIPELVWRFIAYAGICGMLFVCILRVASNTYSAFIYFQF